MQVLLYPLCASNVGPIVDTMNYKEVLINEINSANDNPIVDWERK